MGRTNAYPDHVRAAAVAAYGKRSMSLVAADLGVSTGAVSHWWAAAKRDGIIAPLFGRFDGGSAHEGRLCRDMRTGGTRVDPAMSRDARRRAGRNLDNQSARGGEALS